MGSAKRSSIKFYDDCSWATRAWSEKNRARSVESTLVTCWKKHGWEMSVFRVGRRGAALFLLLVWWPVKSRRKKLDVRPEPFLLGADSRMLAGSAVRVSMCRKSCWAASAESKLNPAMTLWSSEVRIVWNVGPAACFKTIQIQLW